MADFVVNFGRIDFLIVLAMLPSIILGFIIYKKDVVEKEPIGLLIKLFLFGILSSGVALFLELYGERLFPFVAQNNVFSIFIRSFFIIGLSEELVKWLFTYVICWRQKAFNYAYDAIVYAVFISLGFATIENVIAVVGSEGDLLLVLQRGLITVPAHAFFAIISGYYLGMAKRFEKRGWRRKSKKALILSVVVPVLAHGLFDMLLFVSNEVTIILAALFILYLYVSSYLKVIKVSNETKAM